MVRERLVVPHYQQKVDLRSGEVCGFEALLRWTHSRRGIQSPDTIVDAFKEYDLASKIGRLMQEQVLTDIAAWTAAGHAFGTISINAAPAEFLRDDYAEGLLKLLDQRGIEPRLLEVEVTEHVFLERSADYVRRALEVLSGAGIRVSLDDFGTGSSSLSHLRDFPVDVVKIDRSFISRMLEEHEIAAIVSAVIDLCVSLGLQVVAEGIETEDQKAFLAARGCSTGQGFLFGKAIPASDLPAMLRAGR
jgi:EAL domain-containing protein (putative c-di-GMP-specific phosphodiesterase class I)